MGPNNGVVMANNLVNIVDLQNAGPWFPFVNRCQPLMYLVER